MHLVSEGQASRVFGAVGTWLSGCEEKGGLPGRVVTSFWDEVCQSVATGLNKAVLYCQSEEVWQSCRSLERTCFKVMGVAVVLSSFAPHEVPAPWIATGFLLAGVAAHDVAVIVERFQKRVLLAGEGSELGLSGRCAILTQGTWMFKFFPDQCVWGACRALSLMC